MMLTIDSMPSMSYNLNSYYALLPDSENEGLVQFSIPELEPGMHTAEFKVWDILNNSTTYTFTFEVAEGLKPNLIEMYATPNPARDQVEFFLHHNRPESNLKVTVMVYDMITVAGGCAREFICIGRRLVRITRKRRRKRIN